MRISRVDDIMANFQLSLLHVQAQNACKQTAVEQNESAFACITEARILGRPNVLKS